MDHPDIRYYVWQMATLISRSMGWDIRHVQNHLKVRLYCSSQVVNASTADARTYWATESRYPHYNGVRRDMVEVDLGNNKRGLAQLVTFIEMENLPANSTVACAKAVLIRWMSPSSKSNTRDDHGRPLCDYPLSANHCLWQWSDAGRNRSCFSLTGFFNKVTRQGMWDHVPGVDRAAAISAEKRARYDVIQYDNIICHANAALDPSTGHTLHTIQII